MLKAANFKSYAITYLYDILAYILLSVSALFFGNYLKAKSANVPIVPGQVTPEAIALVKTFLTGALLLIIFIVLIYSLSTMLIYARLLNKKVNAGFYWKLLLTKIVIWVAYGIALLPSFLFALTNRIFAIVYLTALLIVLGYFKLFIYYGLTEKQNASGIGFGFNKAFDNLGRLLIDYIWLLAIVAIVFGLVYYANVQIRESAWYFINFSKAQWILAIGNIIVMFLPVAYLRMKILEKAR